MKEQIKRNSNYIYNTENNMEGINEKVAQMVNDDIISNCHDFISHFNGESFPEINHDVLKVPGKFQGIISNKAHRSDGGKKFLDTLELVGPDGDMVTKESMADIEYYIYDYDEDTIYDYDLLTTVKYEKRVFHIHVVNKQPEKIDDLIEVSGHPIKLLHRVFDEERKWKVLNRMKAKDYFTEELTAHEYMELAHCIANATKKDSKEFIRQCVEVFTQIEKIPSEYQKKLFISLKIMIKFIFEGDIEETWRLLEMITKSVPYDFIEPLRTVEDYARRNLEYREEVDKLNSIISDLQSENTKLKSKLLRVESKNS